MTIIENEIDINGDEVSQRKVKGAASIRDILHSEGVTSVLVTRDDSPNLIYRLEDSE